MCALRSQSVAVAIAGVVLAGTATPARADDWSLNLIGAALSGWTDNVTTTSVDPEADFFYQLRPGAVFAYERRRMIHELAYDFEMSLYQEHSEANSYSHRVGWRGFYLTSPRSELTTSAAISTGQSNTFSSRTTADTGEVIVHLSGSSDFVQAELGETFSYQISAPWRILHTGFARRHENRAEGETLTTGMDIGGTVAVDRTWHHDAVTLNGGVSYVTLDRMEEPEPQTQVMSSAAVIWRRDLGPRWSTSADVGATILLATDGSFDPVSRPTIGASMSYMPDWGTATASVRRSVAPNLYIAQNTVSDSAVVSAWLPLPWLTPERRLPRLTVAGTLGFNRTRTIDMDTGDTAQGFNVYMGDVALGWQPRGEGWLNFLLRASYMRQDADESAAVLGYDRTTITLSVFGRFPNRRAAEIPLRAGARVDRQDTDPVGDEAGAGGGGEGGAGGNPGR